MKKQFHITWFVDDKKDKLSGITVEAENIIEAVESICKSKIPIKGSKYVTADIIKYVIEI
jgi:hypothetical protein